MIRSPAFRLKKHSETQIVAKIAKSGKSNREWEQGYSDTLLGEVGVRMSPPFTITSFCGYATTVAFLLTTACPTLVAAEKHIDFSEAALQRIGVLSDDTSLVEYLCNAASARTDTRFIPDLVGKLGSDDFTERDRVSLQIVVLGSLAVPELQRRFNDTDPEIARRTRDCAGRIGKTAYVNLPLLAIRLLVNRGQVSATKAFLRYLPSADQESEEEIYYGLKRFAAKQGSIQRLLRSNLTHTNPNCRAVCACILGRVGDIETKKSVKNLLTDKDNRVRLRAAQGLLASGDKGVLPVLIDLLDDPSTAVCWQAEELLHWAAGYQLPPAVCGAADRVQRKNCQAAWQRWWARNGKELALPDPTQDPSRPGLVLLKECVGEQMTEQGVRKTFRLGLYGCDGNRRYQLPMVFNEQTQLGWAEPACLLRYDSEDQPEWSEWDSTGRSRSRSTHIGDCGSVTWTRAAGQTIIESKAKFVELDLTGSKQQEVVHPRRSESVSSVRLQFGADGRLFELRIKANETNCLAYIRECEVATSRPLKEFAVAQLLPPAKNLNLSEHGFSFQPLRDGFLVNMRVAQEGKATCRLLHVDCTGKVLLCRELGMASSALLLRNNNTLIVLEGQFGGSYGRAIEMDRFGAWSGKPTPTQYTRM